MKPEREGSGKDIVARSVKVRDLISYQEGAIVSRTMIDEKAGTVTLFAFDEGEGLSEHTAPYDALVIDVDGKAEVTISGKGLRLDEGEMVIMPANKPHALRAITRFKMLLVMIRTDHASEESKA